MPVLMIGLEERARIEDVKALAASMPMTLSGITRAQEEDFDGFLDMMKTLAVEFPGGYRAVYSHEMQRPGLCAHLSLSVVRENMVPSPEAVEMILEAFGMKMLATSAAVWTNEVRPGLTAVNVVQVVE